MPRISATIRAGVLGLLTAAAGISPALALIDVKNLNYSNTWIDLTERLGVAVTRTYNSRSLFDGMFGFGWCSDFETTLTFETPGTFSLTYCGSGYSLTFRRRDVAEGRVVLTTDSGDTLEVREDGFLYRSANRKEALHFDRMGDLSEIETPGFGTVRFERQAGRIVRIRDWADQAYVLRYGAAGKVLSIETPSGAAVQYQYDSVGNLQSIRNVWKNVYSYGYDDLHNLIKATWPDKTFIRLSYDKEKDLVTKFVDRNACEEQFSTNILSDDHYSVRDEKRCDGELTVEQLYEFMFRDDGSLWKVRFSSGLPGPGGVQFKETEYLPDGTSRVLRQETLDALHTPLQRSQ